MRVSEIALTSKATSAANEKVPQDAPSLDHQSYNDKKRAKCEGTDNNPAKKLDCHLGTACSVRKNRHYGRKDWKR